jgi:DUF971 family protein
MDADATAADRVAEPVSIVSHQGSGVLEIVWTDDHRSRIAHARLREQCRCAACESQWRRHGTRVQADPGLRLAQIHPVSVQGLNLVFSDGHGRGIYPWSLLRQIGELPEPLTPTSA